MRKSNVFTKHSTPFLMAPYAVLFVLFIIIPIIAAIGLSFTYYNTIETPKFVGLENYLNLFTNDDVFMRYVLPNTVIYAICIGIGGYILAFILAWALSQITKGPRTVLALIIYSPSMTGGVMLSTVWSVIFNGSESGYLNYILLKFNIIDQPVVWLSSEKHLLWIMIVVTLWSSMGIGFLSMLSGANPTPGYSGQLIVSHIEDYGFLRYEMGYAAAVSVVLLAGIYLMTKGVNKLLSSKDE